MSLASKVIILRYRESLAKIDNSCRGGILLASIIKQQMVRRQNEVSRLPGFVLASLLGQIARAQRLVMRLGPNTRVVLLLLVFAFIMMAHVLCRSPLPSFALYFIRFSWKKRRKVRRKRKERRDMRTTTTHKPGVRVALRFPSFFLLPPSWRCRYSTGIVLIL